MASGEAAGASPQADYRGYAAAGVGALQRWYRPWTGRWRSTGWWNAANALTAVITYTQRSGDDQYRHVIGLSFTAARRKHRDYVNSFFDDNGWWGLAWVAAYDLTGEGRYLDAARTIFANMVTGWDDTCGGGVWWNTDRKYKNAITNELFLTLAARLHQRCDGENEYLQWAQREWDWFAARGLIGESGLVNDGLTNACVNNGGVTWTYNQGVVLGGLSALYEITGEREYLAQGEAIADAAIGQLITPDGPAAAGILIEPDELGTDPKDKDRPQFKGVFMRNLYDLNRHSARPAYTAFIQANARSIWDRNRNDRNQFGLHWAGPFDQADACRQSSALDALNAAIPVTGLAAGSGAAGPETAGS
jgi:predicted alpha-1,6-mannanase (GH76 family)